jgi:hypothetical protein
MVGEPQAVTGELHPQDGLSTTAIVLFPLLFWPFFGPSLFLDGATSEVSFLAIDCLKAMQR